MAGPGLVVVVFLVVSGGSICSTASRGPLCFASSRAVLACCSSFDVSFSLGCCLLLVGAAASFVDTDLSGVACTDSCVVLLSGSGRVGVSLVSGCEALSLAVVSALRG